MNQITDTNIKLYDTVILKDAAGNIYQDKVLSIERLDSYSAADTVHTSGYLLELCASFIFAEDTGNIYVYDELETGELVKSNKYLESIWTVVDADLRKVFSRK